MSYFQNASKPGSYLVESDCYQWFNNAMKNAMITLNDSDGRRAFKKMYGFRVVNLCNSVSEVYRIGIEFPNEAEATMFVLRWS